MDAYDLITSGLQLRKLLAKRVEPIMEEYGLRPVELDILEFITKENIDRIHLSKSHISKSLEHLLEKGLINMKEDEDDRRVMRITLTEASYKVIDKVNVAYEQCRQILTEGVSEEELQVFRRVIRQMNDNVNGELE